MKRTNSNGLVVALDGPGSSGKSSVGAAAATRLGYRFVDTGLLYRALTWLALKRGLAEDDVAGIVALVPEVELVPDEQGRLAHVTVDGTEVTLEVRGGEVDARVSGFSRIPELRAALLERQREIAAPGRIIAAGRDIGTVVLPGADLKLFLNASPEERARRRAEERGVDPDGPEGREILAELRRRDAIDTARAVAPLRPADDARVLVTDGNRFEDTVRLVTDEITRAERKRPVPAEPAVAPASPEPLEGHLTPLIRLFGVGARTAARAVTRVRIEGDIGAIPRSGGVLVTVNHVSNADAVVVGAWLTAGLGRRVHWLGKKEMLEWPFVGWMARNASVHPVNRDSADIDAFRMARRVLDEGHVLIVFPEGTRSPNAQLQRPKDGAAMLALRTGATIAPIGVSNSDRVWPRGRKLPRIGSHITMRVGRPYRLADELPPDLDRRTTKARATDLIMRRIAELLDPRHRGVYADPPPPDPQPG